ncbi:hypothetical protein FN846DRAFT_1025005 [Sphaerosporella brunnea]|uniref:Ankyrin repeat-containing domain protein n=1 Tax=Sphaerosporella brunnea TaxID=1250544 RepID=A0A5J5EHV0_9PEZI|nr:hypothetical protein FN846DRAFT_1025005 [Sphaerosporella brunnea]
MQAAERRDRQRRRTSVIRTMEALFFPLRQQRTERSATAVAGLKTRNLSWAADPSSLDSHEDLNAYSLEQSDPASVSAAKKPDPLVLRTVLFHGLDQLRSVLGQRFDESRYAHLFSPNVYATDGEGMFTTTPLLAAVKAGLNREREDIAGGGGGSERRGPVGAVPLCRCLGPLPARGEGWARGVVQLQSLTADELERRAGVGRFAPFWRVHWRSVPTPILGSETMPALVEAARAGRADMFDLLLAEGADKSFWIAVPPQTALPSPPIRKTGHGQIPARPRVQSQCPPIAKPEICLSPLMLSTAHPDMFQILAESSMADFSLRNPIYEVHILHLAAANLSTEQLAAIEKKTPLNTAATTALGHTLLHIACLPYDVNYVNVWSEKIYRSIHDLRSLSQHWERPRLRSRLFALNRQQRLPQEVLPEPPWLHPGPIPPQRWSQSPSTSPSVSARLPPLHSFNVEAPKLQPTSDFARQTETIKYLLDNGLGDSVTAQDCHGNTPLHYLAAYRICNDEALRMLRSTSAGERVWQESTNRWGFTPAEMRLEGEQVTQRGEKEFWLEYGRGG